MLRVSDTLSQDHCTGRVPAPSTITSWTPVEVIVQISAFGEADAGGFGDHAVKRHRCSSLTATSRPKSAFSGSGADHGAQDRQGQRRAQLQALAPLFRSSVGHPIRRVIWRPAALHQRCNSL